MYLHKEEIHEDLEVDESAHVISLKFLHSLK